MTDQELLAQMQAITGKPPEQMDPAVMAEINKIFASDPEAARTVVANPTMMKRVVVGAIERVKGVKLGNPDEVPSTVLGEAATFDAAKTGPMERVTATTVDQTAANQSRGYQRTLAEELAARMRGEKASVAELQLKRSADRNLSAALGQAASARGVNPALAARLAQKTVGGINQTAAMDAAILRAQEQQAAEAGLANVAGTMRGQDLTVATEDARFKNTADTFNADWANKGNVVDTENEQRAREQNTGAKNQFKTIQHQTDFQKALADTAAKNEFRTMQADMDWRTQAVNAQASNDRNLAQADIDTRTEAFNAGAQNDAKFLQAELDADREKFNAGLKSERDMQQAGYIFENGTWNLKGRLQDRSEDIDMTKYTTGQIMGREEQDKQRVLQREQLAYQDQWNRAKIESDERIARKQIQASRDNAIWGAVGGVGGAVAGSLIRSDKNEKKNVKSGDDEARAFLDALSAHTYDYKNPGRDGSGRRLGVMAQDVEKSKLGRPMVTDSPDGKSLDVGRGFGAVLAAQANLNERLSALEAALKPKKKKG